MLYQPVQRMLNVAMVDLNCDSLCSPRLDPRRIVSAGVVIRRVYRAAGPASGQVTEEFHTLSGWMRCPKGKYSWTRLSPDQEDCDPDPTQRPQLQSGQPDLDLQLAAQALSTATHNPSLLRRSTGMAWLPACPRCCAQRNTPPDSPFRLPPPSTTAGCPTSS